MRKSLALAVAALVLLPGLAAAQTVVYSGIPTPLPFNLVSLGYQATSTYEFGDHVQFEPVSGTAVFRSVTVTMSSWACESGSWSPGPCTTTPGTGFTHPITLNIYAVDSSSGDPEPGGVLATTTQTFFIPYRPSSIPGCAGNRWLAGDGICYNGLAHNIVFDLSTLQLELPSEVIIGVAYNTGSYGAQPLGVTGPYDSLNVGLLDAAPYVGTDVEADVMFWDRTGDVGGFQRDTGWSPYSLAAEVVATVVNPPASANACKKDGWKLLTRMDGTKFKNQGACVSYVNTGK
jgi:hypothetical protein